VTQGGSEHCWYFPYSNCCRLAEFLEGTVLNWWASLTRLVWVRASIEQERCLGGAVLYGQCPPWSGEAGFLPDGKPVYFLPSWRDKWVLSTWYQPLSTKSVLIFSWRPVFRSLALCEIFVEY